VVDFGSQEFTGAQHECLKDVADFLRRMGKSDESTESFLKALPFPGGVRNVYDFVGIEYLSLDVDERFGAAYFDLNSYEPAPSLRGRFDLVNNEGTIEHLVNPINGFQVAHELVKVGGVIRHSMPLCGWQDHGVMYPTQKFYAQLVTENVYDILESVVEINSVTKDFDFFQQKRSFYDLPSVDQTNFWTADVYLHLTYRKSKELVFKIPVDHLYFDTDRKVAQRIQGDFAAITCHRLPHWSGKDGRPVRQGQRYTDADLIERLKQENEYLRRALVEAMMGNKR